MDDGLDWLREKSGQIESEIEKRRKNEFGNSQEQDRLFREKKARERLPPKIWGDVGKSAVGEAQVRARHLLDNGTAADSQHNSSPGGSVESTSTGDAVYTTGGGGEPVYKYFVGGYRHINGVLKWQMRGAPNLLVPFSKMYFNGTTYGYCGRGIHAVVGNYDRPDNRPAMTTNLVSLTDAEKILVDSRLTVWSPVHHVYKTRVLVSTFTDIFDGILLWSGSFTYIVSFAVPLRNTLQADNTHEVKTLMLSVYLDESKLDEAGFPTEVMVFGVATVNKTTVVSQPTWLAAPAPSLYLNRHQYMGPSVTTAPGVVYTPMVILASNPMKLDGVFSWTADRDPEIMFYKCTDDGNLWYHIRDPNISPVGEEDFYPPLRGTFDYSSKVLNMYTPWNTGINVELCSCVERSTSIPLSNDAFLFVYSHPKFVWTAEYIALGEFTLGQNSYNNADNVPMISWDNVGRPMSTKVRLIKNDTVTKVTLPTPWGTDAYEVKSGHYTQPMGDGVMVLKLGRGFSFTSEICFIRTSDAGDSWSVLNPTGLPAHVFTDATNTGYITVLRRNPVTNAVILGMPVWMPEELKTVLFLSEDVCDTWRRGPTISPNAVHDTVWLELMDPTTKSTSFDTVRYFGENLQQACNIAYPQQVEDASYGW